MASTHYEKGTAMTRSNAMALDRQPEGGAATVAMLAILAATLALSGIVASAPAEVTARRRAAAAADLAALAGARYLAAGAGYACQRAAKQAEVNAAKLVGCRSELGTLLVTVAVPAALSRETTATARAGPVPTRPAQ